MIRRNSIGWASGIGVVGSLLAVSHVSAKDVPTTCSDICDTLTATTCIVTAIHDVVVGSNVDCTSARDITINGGELRVHDGEFALRGKSVVLANGGKIVADCPQAFWPVGFALSTVNDVTINSGSQGKLSARCGIEGGRVVVEAAGNVTIDGLGIDVEGAGTDAPGGYVRLEALGTVTILADVTAQASSQGAASGGRIRIRGASVDVQAEVRAKGYGAGSVEMPGGDIEINAAADVDVSAGPGLNAESAKGAGGSITIHAGEVANVTRPLKASGTGGSVGSGGVIHVSGDEVRIDGDVTATGGRQGGTFEIEGLAGGVAVGGNGAATLDVTGGNAESGGTIRITADGGPITLGGSATLRVNGGNGASAGRIEVDGMDVTTNGGTKLFANGASPSGGGGIDVTGRGVMSLSGTMEATPGGRKSFFYKDTVPTISGTITDYDLVQLPML